MRDNPAFGKLLTMLLQDLELSLFTRGDLHRLLTDHGDVVFTEALAAVMNPLALLELLDVAEGSY